MLTLDQVRVKTPSVFALAAKEGVSDRYTFVPTYQVLESFMSRGWEIDRALEVNTRTENNRNFQKHAVTMLHPDLPSVNGSKVTATVINRATTGRRMSSRAVTGIDQNIKLNQVLWQLTEQFAQLKG